MWFLGWDCANRTLACVLMRLDKAELNACIAECEAYLSGTSTMSADEIRARAREVIHVKHMQVADILGDNIKTFTRVQLARKLGAFLENSAVSIAAIAELRPIVIVEYQPPKLARWGGATTEQASTVAHQLMFYYRDFEVSYIDSKEKNKIALAPNLTHELYMAGCGSDSQKKTARKRHTTDNFLHIIKHFHCEGDSIKKSLVNHAADAFMQILAFVKNNP